MENETNEERKAREKAEIEKSDRELAETMFGIGGTKDEDEDSDDPLVNALKSLPLGDKKGANAFAKALFAKLSEGADGQKRISDFVLKLLQQVGRLVL
jgi:hypothetical protein